jgi:general stress protein 26
MDSINQNQSEQNHKDLIGAQAAKKIKELFEKAENCFFCTRINSGQKFSTRPMAVQEVTDEGICYFLSASDSHKNAHIKSDPHVQLLFQGSNHSEFVTLHGTATITQDRNRIKELWKPILKTWFTEGEDDPRITVIAIVPQDGYYWDTKHGEMVAFAKQMIGATIGKTMDDSIEGRLVV